MLEAQRQLDEPSAALAGAGVGRAIRRAFLATRPAFFVAAVLPVMVGTAWAGAAFHRFNGLLFALALLATVLAHAAANVYNDVGDDVIGADPGNDDRIYPYTGGSRFIQSGLLSRRQMGRLAAGLAVAAVLLGGVLALLRGPGVILFGIAGLGLGLLYSLPGLQLSARGLGELAVGTAFGVLPALGAMWLQTGRIDAGAVLLSLPVGAWATAILVINEVPDIEPDRRAGKRTLVVRWGGVGARLLYRGLSLVALGACAGAMLWQALPRWYALPALVLAVLGFKAAAGISTEPAGRARLKRSIELTLAVHAMGGIALILGILLGPAG